MALKRNEPGCRCCGFGLAANPGDTTIKILTKGTGVYFLQSTGTFNVTNTFGSGSVVIGTDPERGRILCQKTDGSIHYLESKTNQTGEMFATGTDVSTLDIYYLYYQDSYDHGGGFYLDGADIKGFSINSSGSFIISPFTFPTIYDYFLEDSQDSISVAVDESGNIYAGVTFDVGSQRLQFLKNGSEYTYTPNDGSGIVNVANPLSVLPQFAVWENGNILNYTYKRSGPKKDTITEKSSAGEIEVDDIIINNRDVTGSSDTIEGRIRAYTQYNDNKGRIDYIDSLLGWYRIDKDLTMAERLFPPSDQLLVTYCC